MDAPIFQRVNGLFETGKLAQGKVLAVSAVIRNCKMGEDSFRNQSRQTAGFLHFVEGIGALVRRLVDKPDAAHAGIHFQMHFHLYPGYLCIAGKLSGVVQGEHALGNIQLRKLFGFLGRRIAQNQNGPGNGAAAQLNGLF